MAEGGTPPRESPPKAIVDSSPILNSLEQNKESLKVKLMLRRPLEQLVDQGIMPPLKTPGAFHGQRRQLERAKTGDLLKSKIQQRPSRTELESRHILEPDPHVDPSLADKQRKLKKARLADQLNVQLSHRPGPLELIRKNILHTEEPIEHAVKAGHIPYRATCEGQLNRPQQPLSYVNPEDDSQSSEDNSTSPGPADVLETAAKSAGIVVSLISAPADAVVVATSTGQLATLAPLKTDSSDIVFADLCRSVAAPLLTQASAASPASLVSSTSTLSPLSSIASPGPSTLSQPTTPGPPLQLVTQRPLAAAATNIVAQLPQVRTDAPGKDKNRKKSKSKAIPKARTIKFHEYKGPPSAQKSSASTFPGAEGESSYQLLLEQQQLLLQYQLEHSKNNKLCLILPAQTSSDVTANNGHSATPVAATSAVIKSAPATSRFLGRLEDMKVTDLKAELKRRSLPVSGSKPQLIERLKPFANATVAQSPANGVNSTATTSCDSFQEIEASHDSPMYNVDTASPQTIASEEQSEHMDVNECEPPSPAMSLSQQAIETPESREVISLQQRRIEELERQLRLHKQKLEAATKTQYVQLLERIQSLAAQQNAEVEQKMQQQQQQHVAFQNQKNQADGSLLLSQLIPDKVKLINGHNRSNSLPNFFQTVAQTHMKPEQHDIKSPPAPPLYDDTLLPKMLKKKDAVKSQDVDDVLEILIKSGELPPSAAQDPLTPGNVIKAEQPVFSGMEFPNHIVTNPLHHQQQQQIFQHLLQHHPHPPPLQPQQETAESILGLDANDILHHIDIDDFMELCGQHNNINNNAAAMDNANADVSMETDDEWLDLLQSGPTVDNSFANANGMPTVATTNNNLPDVTPSQELGYDPVIAIGQNPHDPFNLDEFRSPPDWDRLDFAV
ncbi:myocardin-related transcription factor B isoform X2 [Atheta coriaria]